MWIRYIGPHAGANVPNTIVPGHFIPDTPRMTPVDVPDEVGENLCQGAVWERCAAPHKSKTAAAAARAGEGE